jgi:hypothetical protein
MASFLWEIFAKAWHFTIPSFGLGQLLPNTKVHTISFGFWLRVNSEGTNSQVTSAAMVRTHHGLTALLGSFMDTEQLDRETPQSIILHLRVRDTIFVFLSSILVPMMTS